MQNPPPADPYGLLHPNIRVNPYAAYARLRAEAPVYFSEALGGWILTRYADVHAAFRDARLSSKRPARFAPQWMEQMRDAIGPMVRNMSAWVLMMDPPDHTRIRSLINRAFTPRMVEFLRPRIQGLADGLLDAAAKDGPIDLMSDFAVPLPVLVIGEMLGLPAEDRHRLKAWSNGILTVGARMPTLEQVRAMAQAFTEIEVYMRGVIAERRQRPGQDLISELLAAEEQGKFLSEQEILSTCTMLLFAGHETTTNLIGNGTYALLRQPDQLQVLRDTPEVLPTAVEEFLRFDSPVQRMARVAKEDVELGGQRVRQGDILFLNIGAANRDPEQFANPDALDVRREDNRHVAFGLGIHYCVGAPLGRLEGELALGTLLRRFPKLELAGEGVWRDNLTLRGLESLPVRLAP